MSDCSVCGGTLVGRQPIPKDEGPFGVGDEVPPLDTDEYDVDKEVAFIICPSCGDERPFTIRDWHEPPSEL